VTDEPGGAAYVESDAIVGGSAANASCTGANGVDIAISAATKNTPTHEKCAVLGHRLIEDPPELIQTPDSDYNTVTVA